MNIADLTTASPAVIDAAWAEALEPIHAKQAKAVALMNQSFAKSDRAASRKDKTGSAYHSLRDEANALATEAYNLNNEARLERWIVERPFRAEYKARNGWTRAYKVSGGHVHSSANCSTCHKMGQRTDLYWVTELSGMTTDEIAELAGEAACTVCYPNAPVHKPTQVFTLAEANKIVGQRERAAKLDKANAVKRSKAITMPDGTPLRDSFGFIVKTERTASIELTNCLVNLTHVLKLIEDGADHLGQQVKEYNTTITNIVDALAHKQGASGLVVLARHQEKAAKKYKRDYAS